MYFNYLQLFNLYPIDTLFSSLSTSPMFIKGLIISIQLQNCKIEVNAVAVLEQKLSNVFDNREPKVSDAM